MEVGGNRRTLLDTVEVLGSSWKMVKVMEVGGRVWKLSKNIPKTRGSRWKLVEKGGSL